MGKTQDVTKGVSMKSTKQEIMDALMNAQKIVESLTQQTQTPTEVAEKKCKEQCVKNAADDVAANIFSPEFTEKYKNLMAAIEVQEKRLKDLYDIDTSLMDTAIVLNANKQVREEHNAILRELDEELQAHKDRNAKVSEAYMNDIREENARKTNELQDALKQEKVKLDRSLEQYEYEIQIKKRDKDAIYDAHVADREKEINELTEKIAKLRYDVEDLDELTLIRDELPKEKQASYDEGYAAGKADAGKEYGYKAAAEKKDHEHAVEMMQKDIDAITQRLDEKTKELESTKEGLADAYVRINDLAKVVAETSGSVKVINNESQSRK